MDMFTLLSWIYGQDPKNAFNVEISREAIVGRLKATVKSERSAILKDVDAADLELYPLFVPSNANRTAELKKWRAHGKEPLDVDQTVDQVFPNRRDGKWIVIVTHPSFLCWIRGDDVNHVFPVKISREADVEDLKDTLKLKRSTTLRDVDAANLDLYGLLVPSDGNQAAELGKWRLGDKKPLDVKQKLSNAFPRTQEGEWVVVVNYPTATTKFHVYFKNQTLLVSAVAHDMVKDFLLTLLRDQQHRKVFKDVSASQLNVYQLNPPVLVTERRKFLEHLERMEDTDAVELSFGESTVTPQHVCMALMLTEDESSKAIEALKRDHSKIFSCLQLTVGISLKWTKGDVESNLAGGRYTEHDEATVPEIREIRGLLGSRRIYDDIGRMTRQQVRDLKIAREVDERLFERIFTALSGNGDGVVMVRNTREFSTFYHVLRCYHEDATKIRDQKSSAVRAANFATYFIQPPFLSPGNPDIKYRTEMPWGFPLFVRNNAADSWRKYTPKSDLMVSSAGHLIPFFVSEVISKKNQEDRYRMLLQAIAVARAGKKLLKETSKRPFFVVAVYLDMEMVASRYIVTQTGRDRDDPAGVYHGNATRPMRLNSSVKCTIL
ncbi:hypothetical protein EDD15DRAFT_1473424 [Pisolithus albus]|nr:hypothetical protein EDD15DRAFT_1473424 [Pisolithus albus]